MTDIPAAVAASVAYVASIAAANWATNRYGFIPMGFGLDATAGTLFAGAALLLRDFVHDLGGARLVIALIFLGAGLSWWLSTPALALASGVAFGISELADMAVYTPLRRRRRRSAVVASNIVGAVVDTLAFLWIAGFPVTPRVVAGQLLGKSYATAAYLIVDAVPRQRQHATGA